jgi:hypothetical protein
MGLEDRDYMSEDKSKTHDVKVCPKTGHWIGVVDCSECDWTWCIRHQFYKNVPLQAVNPSENNQSLEMVSEPKIETIKEQTQNIPIDMKKFHQNKRLTQTIVIISIIVCLIIIGIIVLISLK